MKRLVLVTCGLVLVTCVGGCGSSADSLMKEQIKLMNEMADAVESGADQSKIDAIGKKMKENEEKFNGLKLSEEEKKKLVEKYNDDIAKAVTRMMGAMFKKGDVKIPDLGGLGGAPPGKDGGSKK